MPLTSKHRALVLFLVSTGLTVLIAAGLPLLAFAPGLPLPSFEQGQVMAPRLDRGPAGMPMSRFAGVLVLIILGALLLVLAVRAMRRVPWRRLLAGALSLLWKLVLVGGLILLVVSLLPRSTGALSGEPMPQPKPLATGPLGPVPHALILVAAIVLGAVVLLLAVWMLAARRAPAPRSWEHEVEQARRALLDGQDLREVIIRCYQRMGEALQEESGIERETFMTTGEFEQLLAAKGLPREPVRQLTRLFEAARYSLREPVPGEERGALNCLEAILGSLPPATGPADGGTGSGMK